MDRQQGQRQDSGLASRAHAEMGQAEKCVSKLLSSLLGPLCVLCAVLC